MDYIIEGLPGNSKKSKETDLYNLKRALELGYEPNEAGHLPSVDEETGMFLKSMDHPTAWKEYMYGQLNKDIGTNTRVVVNPEGYFGDKQLQYKDKYGNAYRDGGGVGNLLTNPFANNPYSIKNIMQRDWNNKLNQSREEVKKKDLQKQIEEAMVTDDGKPYEYKGKTIKDYDDVKKQDSEEFLEFLRSYEIYDRGKDFRKHITDWKGKKKRGLKKADLYIQNRLTQDDVDDLIKNNKSITNLGELNKSLHDDKKNLYISYDKKNKVYNVYNRGEIEQRIYHQGLNPSQMSEMGLGDRQKTTKRL